MTATNPFAPAAGARHPWTADAQIAQVVPPEVPVRIDTETVYAALQDVHQRAREVGDTYEVARLQYVLWQERVARSAQPDAAAPEEIVAPMRDAEEAVNHLRSEREGLLRQWDETGTGWELPHHGLPQSNFMRDVFELQRPTPLPYEERRNQMQRRFDMLAQDAGLLHETHLGNPAAVAHRLEATYASILQARRELLQEWDAAGMGTETPPHGVTPDAGEFFDRFEQVDAERLAAILARS